MILKRVADPERELILVPANLEKRIIRILHERVGKAHQAAMALATRIIIRCYWPRIIRDIKLNVACCTSCEEYLRHSRTTKAELRLIEVGGQRNCLAIDFVGGGEFFPLTPRANKYIITLGDYFLRYALAIPIADQSSKTCD